MDDRVTEEKTVAVATECSSASADDGNDAPSEQGNVAGKSEERTRLLIREHPFSKKTWKEDLTLLVDGECFYVNKALLATYSKVFNERFEDESESTIELQGKSFESVLEFLCCLYPNIRKPVTIQNIHLVMPLAIEFEAENLLSECQACIRDNATSSSSADVLLHLIHLCQSLNLKGLEKICWESVKDKDVQDIEEIESKSSDKEITNTITKIKSEKLKTMFNNSDKKVVRLQKESDSYKGILLFLMKDMDTPLQMQIRGIIGGYSGEFFTTFLVMGKEFVLRDQKDQNYQLTMKSHLHVRSIVIFECSLKRACFSTVMGRLTIVNRVNPMKSLHFPFNGTFSQSVTSIGITNVKWNDITADDRGFLVESEGIVQVEYISKR